MVLFIVIFALVLVVAALTWHCHNLRKHNRELAAEKMASAVAVSPVESPAEQMADGNNYVTLRKEQQVLLGGYMAFYAKSVERFDSVIKNIGRKMVSGQMAEVQRLLSSEWINEQNRKEFHTVFDRGIVMLYPDFAQRINSLLKDDRRIDVPSPGVLTTELRVAAFTVLGVDDASMIARLLGVSQNTIYTYRNRMRSRAIDRDSFDRALQEIHTVSAN